MFIFSNENSNSYMRYQYFGASLTYRSISMVFNSRIGYICTIEMNAVTKNKRTRRGNQNKRIL